MSLAASRSHNPNADLFIGIFNKPLDRTFDTNEVMSKMAQKTNARSHNIQNPRRFNQSSSSTRDNNPAPEKLSKRTTQLQLERTPRTSTSKAARTYTRPTGPDIVRPHLPSSTSLPQNWCPIHDRFIAYLATHAPLTKKGDVPVGEAEKERWDVEDMVGMLGERFPRLGGEKIKPSVIEKRLALLDEAGDNDYFKMGYRAYEFEEWGRGI